MVVGAGNEPIGVRICNRVRKWEKMFEIQESKPLAAACDSSARAHFWKLNVIPFLSTVRIQREIVMQTIFVSIWLLTPGHWVL